MIFYYFLFLNGLFVEYFGHLLLFELSLLLFGILFIYLLFERLRIMFEGPKLFLFNPNSWNYQVKVFNFFFFLR